MVAPALFGSKWEENFYRAMVQMRREFEYQVPFFGGRFVRGGTVVDFVDQTPGQLRPICIYVDGPHWHRQRTGKEVEDRLVRARLEQRGYQVKVIEEEAETYEGCLKWIREEVA